MKKHFEQLILLILVFQCLWQKSQGNVTNNIPLLIYSTTKDIRIFNTTKNNIHNKFIPTILVRNFTEGPTVDFHYEQKKICWTDHALENIQCSDLDPLDPKITDKNKVEVIKNVVSPTDMACDWLTNKLYWTDSDTNRLEVATMEGKHRKILFWTEIDQPRAIALIPMKGLLFWTDWGDVPKIERAGMDGDPSTRKIIVSSDIFWPNGLSIDYESETIYWIDGKLKFIESMTYDGSNRKKVLEQRFEYPFALSIFHTKIFWTDWKTWSLHLYDSFTRETKELYHHVDLVPMFVKVFDKRRQPRHSHPCERNNGGCSHLCLLSPKPPFYSCGCPTGIKLINNFTCADGPQEMLILARRTEICLIYLDSPDYSHKVLPITGTKYTIAVDYDPIDEYIYWSDDDVKKIQRARLNGSEQQVVFSTYIQHPDGIAIDWVSRNIYWTDAGTDRVEVSRLNTNYRYVVISEDLVDPRAIAVASELGWLFWSDWNQENPKVERSNLDGSERKAIIVVNLAWPNGITLDLANQRLYWCDAKLDKIEHANMDGSDRKVLISNSVPHVFGFSLMGDFLYWTDWQTRTIERVHKDSGAQHEILIDQMPNVMGLKAIKFGAVAGKNLCSENNGNCSQFCFHRHNKTRVCVCQLGFELKKDRKTCVKPKTFLLYAKTNKFGMIGIENENNEITIPVVGISHASAIDYDLNTMRLYWSDSNLRTIMRAFLNGSDPQKVVNFGLGSPEGIAIDWLALNIYWTDPAAHRIEVSRLLGSSRRTLLWEGKVYDPRSIILDPLAGYMYWSEWGSSSCIKRAAMDGSNPSKLIATKGYAADLALDYEKKRLYWIDIHAPAIISIDLYGHTEIRIVQTDIFKPIGLTLYKDSIYWSEGATGTIFKASKLDGSNRTKIHQLSGNVTDLLLYHEKTARNSHCAVSNGGCTHLCLALPSDIPEEPVKFTCACPTHYTLVKNECHPPEQFMIYSQKNLTVRILPNPTGCLEAVLPIQGLKGVKAIDFDPVENFLYWIEGKTPTIKRAEVGGNETKIVFVIHGNPELQPYDLAVDSIGRLLFWTCAKQNVINVTRLDNDAPIGVVVNQPKESPRLLAIHLTKRLLFYTDEAQRQLIRTRLDGSHRVVITKNADIAAIAVDTENDWIVWAQEHNIYASNIDGENQHVLFNENHSRITQLTVLSGWLYWIDRESSQLQRVELQSGNYRSSLSLQASTIVDIISVTKPDERHQCFQLRKCSHLCILNGTSAICACPNNNVLKDGKTCSASHICGIERFSCTTNPTEPKDCIPLQWKCDGQNDCHDGSDEEDCHECDDEQFKCKNDGRCIEPHQYCDNTPHCSDKSDEENCCKGFKCPNTQRCIPLEFVCNKNEDCADGADENYDMCESREKKNDGVIVVIIVGVSVICVCFASAFYCLLRRFKYNEEIQDQSEDSLSPMQPKPLIKGQKMRKGIPDVVRMSMVTGSDSSSYDRNHITGASSSMNASSVGCYPREPLNPPPSPATTRGSSPSSRYRPYRHYRSINQPPPPTPCSTDVCDESDYNYPTRSRYDGGPFPPPPTPRSHCHSESCPPSPSSRSSTYFNPLPPPPSPVASPRRGYDS